MQTQPASFASSLFSAYPKNWTFSSHINILPPLFPSSCWLSLEGGLLYSFVGPAAAVVLVCILTLTSHSITITHSLFLNALPFITFSHPCCFLLLANRWIWSLVFWSSTSWYPRTASPTWSWRRELGRSYWSSLVECCSYHPPISPITGILMMCFDIKAYNQKRGGE